MSGAAVRVAFYGAVLFAAPLLFCADPDSLPDPLRDRALAGDAAAQLALGDAYFFGRDGRRANPALAAYWFRRASENGDPAGSYNLAVCYEKGWGVPASAQTAYELFRSAAERGVPEARLRQALMLFSGVPEEAMPDNQLRPAIAADRLGALAMLRGLVRSGYAPAERELAILILTDPDATRQFAAEARQLLERAATDRDAEALLLLAGALVFRRKDIQ